MTDRQQLIASRRKVLEASFGVAVAVGVGASGGALAQTVSLSSIDSGAKNMRSSTFTYLSYMRAAPHRVWAAFIDPEVQKRIWLGHFFETSWQAGASWRMIAADGRTANSGEIVGIDPPHHLVLTWRNDIYPERIVEGYSSAVLKLEAAEGATRFTVTHAIGRPDSKLIAAASGSWPLVLSNLKSVLETGHPALG